jgi:hypothetical protein
LTRPRPHDKERIIMKRTSIILQMLVRIMGALAFLAIALFCGFGFLASFEPGNGWLWKAGYAALGCLCLAGAAILLRRLR